MNNIHIILILIIAALILSSCSSEHRKKTEIKLAPEQMCVSFIDVGKGDCILITKNGKNILIDSGYAKTADEVSDYLKENNVTIIDLFIITHYDKDHVGGAEKIIGDFVVKKIYLPDYDGIGGKYEDLMRAVKENSIPSQRVTEIAAEDLDGTEVTVYPSDAEFRKVGKEWNDNDLSLVVSLRYGSDSFLFAGDIEDEGTESFLAKCPQSFDVLKYPHHGKKSERMNELLGSVSPKITVITDSKDEPASEKVISAIEDIGSEIYRSSENGTIAVICSGTGEYTVE